jgi:hypothetical protein
MTSRLITAPDTYLRDLAQLVADHGINEFEGDVVRLAVTFRAARLNASIVDLMVDRAASTPARERALGYLICELARGPARTSTAAA